MNNFTPAEEAAAVNLIEQVAFRYTFAKTIQGAQSASQPMSISCLYRPFYSHIRHRLLLLLRLEAISYLLRLFN